MASADDPPPYNLPNLPPFRPERNNRSYDYPPPPLGHERNKNSYDLNSKIMITAITSLALVVVLVIMLHTYARCVLRRQARRRATIRVLGHTLTGVRSCEPPKNGLDPSVIASLPVFVFKQDEENTTTTTECAVCLSMFEEEEMAMVLPNCNHTFHAECIDKWLSSHSTCPICRTEAEPKVLPEAQEGVVGGAPPMAPPLEHANSSVMISEGTSDGAGQSSAKVGGSNSRLNSFRRMLTRERSSRIIQPCAQEDTVIQDLERQ